MIFVAYAKALLFRKKRLAKDATIPRLERTTKPRKAPWNYVWNLDRALGLQKSGTLPFIYPQMHAFRTHLMLMTRPDFPISVMGSIHTGSRIVRYRPIGRHEVMHGKHWVEGHRDVERGIEFDLCSLVYVGTELVWEATHTVLSRRSMAMGMGRGENTDSIPPDAGEQLWDVGLYESHRYADASGDFNPIHMAHWTARLFGFKSAITHGMWCAGKIAEAHAKTVAGPTVMIVRFKLPIFMPAKILHKFWRRGDTLELRLFDESGAKPHLIGTMMPHRAKEP